MRAGPGLHQVLKLPEHCRGSAVDGLFRFEDGRFERLQLIPGIREIEKSRVLSRNGGSPPIPGSAPPQDQAGDDRRPGASNPGSSRSADRQLDQRGSAGLRAVLRDDGVPNAYRARTHRQTGTRAHAFAFEHPVCMRSRIRHHRINSGSEVKRTVAVGMGAEKLEERTRPRMQCVRLSARG